MKKHLLAAQVTVVLTLLFVSCSPPEHRLLGRWERDGVVIQVEDNKTDINARILQLAGANNERWMKTDMLIWSDIKIIKDNEYLVYKIDEVINTNPHGEIGISMRGVSKKAYFLNLEQDGTRLSLIDRSNGQNSIFQIWQKVDTK